MKIFVADDSARLCEQITGMLSGLSEIEIVGQAQDARSATQAIYKLKPDVVTLDLYLSGGSGIEVLKKIKQKNIVPCVIMLTNHSSLPYRKTCMEVGADFFFDKSTELRKVKEVIQSLVEGFHSTAPKPER
jgi:DNA-binding NarL/FixJ family response regulator